MAYTIGAPTAHQFIDSNGAPATGHVLYFYITGTSTPTNIAFDSAGSSTATSVTIGATGLPTNSGSPVAIYYNDATTYDIVRKDSGGTAYGPTIVGYSVLQDVGSAAIGVLSAAASSADIIKADLATSPGSMSDQLQVIVELTHAANTIANPTFNLNSLGAKTIKRDNNLALQIGDTGGAGYKMYLSYSLTNDVWMLLNPRNNNNGYGLEWKTGLSYIQAADADHDITVSAGSIMDTNNVYRMTLASAFTKQIDATFAVGTALGGLSDDDALGNNTWYGIWLLSKSTNPNDCDVIFATTKAKSLSDAVATAAGFNISRLIGAVKTDGSANIIDFVDGGDNRILWDVPIDASISESSGGTSSTVVCPPFMNVLVTYTIEESGGGTSVVGLLTQTNQTNTAPTATIFSAQAGDTGFDTVQMELKVSSSSQIRHREVGLGFATLGTVDLLTYGWRFLPTVTDLV